MKKTITLAMLSALILTSCMKMDTTDNVPPQPNESEEAIANFEQRYGVKIDSNQDWNSTVSSEVKITANANLNDIVKVQILTESPFLNNEAKVLNEAQVQKGATVKLTYSIPNIYKQLIAACIDSKGVYFIQVFNVGQESVSFPQANASSRRAAKSEAPTFDKIKLGAPQKSLNTQRAESDDAKYDAWNNSNWSDQMWAPVDQDFDNGWRMDICVENGTKINNRGVIFRDGIADFAEGELENVKAILNVFLQKYASADKKIKKNNLPAIRNSAYFKTDNNYFETDGNPVTLIPIQAFTDDFKQNHIYYYYFRPEDIPSGMSEVDYIKQLPKYKAIQVERIQTTVEKNDSAIYHRREFLLPFYEEAPFKGEVKASATFPAGYKIGFLNQKCQNGTDISNNKYGCTYGDGRLNEEVNHFGDFKKAMDKSLGGETNDGMTYTDPRIATFTANGKTYMCFEEGVDCNFTDMVIEVGGGLIQIDEKPQPEAEAYTMCFEDRPQTADYDMNDVVLRTTRLGEDKIQLSIIACGAYDAIVLGGIQGSEEKGFNGKEVHELFGYEYGQKVFINTEKNAAYIEPVTEIVTVEKNLSMDDFLKSIYIENRTTGKTIKVPEKGEAPNAIIIPINFRYPLERKSITDAYPDFLNWAVNMNVNKDWYLYWEEDFVYPDKFSKQ